MSPKNESLENTAPEARVTCCDRDDAVVILRLLHERDQLRVEKEALKRRCIELEAEVAEVRATMTGQLARIEGWMQAADLAHIAQFVRATSMSSLS